MAKTDPLAAPRTELIRVPKESVDEMVERLKQAGYDNIRAILEAADRGRITPEIRDALLVDLVDDLAEAAKFGLDVLVVLPDPGEEVSDFVIDKGIEALEPLLVKLIVKVGGAIHEFFDRDEERLLRRIKTLERNVAEADNKRERKRREKRLSRLRKILLRAFPEAAHRRGWRLNLDGEIEIVRRDGPGK